MPSFKGGKRYSSIDFISRTFTKMDWDIDDAFFEFVSSAVSSEIGSNNNNTPSNSTAISTENFDSMDLTDELNNFLSQHVWESDNKVSAHSRKTQF